ncbi:hypothetical protein [Chitinolyticbacter meiyuanensis]|uniref:hypothetical protein n=1 Tax=Chitinolyticbacter meiyuanensis TaxID=682798 RepID=UPI0011E5BA3F|nr:hypothetical protein [Chitinolyticbacter meiyuanensis]
MKKKDVTQRSPEVVPDITEQEARDIMHRCEAASPGPWTSFVEGRDHTCGSNFIQTSGEDIELSGVTVADQDFIAAARQDLPRLLAMLARLQGWSL